MDQVYKNIWQGIKYYGDKTSKQYTLSTILNSNKEIDYSNKTFENFYKYINVQDGTNMYLMRFEDIKYIMNNKTIYLSENDIISEFNNNGDAYLNNTIQDYNGAFLYPDIIHKNNIIIDNTDINPSNYITIDVGKELSIPVTFEYCLNNTSGNNPEPISLIKKSLYFDIKDSLFIDPKNYLIEITINNNFSTLNNYLDSMNMLQPENNE